MKYKLCLTVIVNDKDLCFFEGFFRGVPPRKGEAIYIEGLDEPSSVLQVQHRIFPTDDEAAYEVAALSVHYEGPLEVLEDELANQFKLTEVRRGEREEESTEEDQ